jgi:hypothetical protein
MTEHQDWKWWKDEAYKAAARAEAAEKLAAMPYDITGLNAALDEVRCQRERVAVLEEALKNARSFIRSKAPEGSLLLQRLEAVLAALEAKP